MCGESSLQLNVAVDELGLRGQGVLLRQFLNRHAVDPKAIYSVELVFEEMVGNVIRHGKASGTIRFSIDIDATRIVITISDNGVPYDPTGIPQPEIPDAAARASVGGLGIHMVKSRVDRMNYRRLGQENRLEIQIDIGPR
jgi:serine/threonine-protein kinase RsbW